MPKKETKHTTKVVYKDEIDIRVLLFFKNKKKNTIDVMIITLLNL